MGVYRKCALGFLAFALTIAEPAIAATKSAQDYYNDGFEAQSEENWYRAVEAYQEALQKNTAYGDAWYNLAFCTYQLEEYDLALTYLQSAEKYSRSYASIQNLKGMIYIALGRFDEARDIFNAILKKYPNDVDARFGLAELDLFTGSLSGAEKYYLAALDRQRTNRNALLSLALVSMEKGNYDTARSYINTALRVHSGDAVVHYLASYIMAKHGELSDAERQARAAVQIRADYDKAYELLASILYESKRYNEAIDICDYRIGRNKKCSSAWYLKGLCQKELGKIDEAVQTFEDGVRADPYDEMMRAALELLITQTIDIEDARRPSWAEYHINRAKEYERRFDGPQSRFEYQRALRLDPLNSMARTAFARMLSRDGFNEMYLSQLKFIEEQRKKTANESETLSDTQKYELTRNAYTMEALDALMKNSLATKWNVQPFYLDKIRWRIGLYYTPSTAHFIHPDAERITAEMSADIFSGVATTVVEAASSAVKGYGEAYSLARKEGRDYFVMMKVDEDDRSFTIDATIYSARTGSEVTSFTVYRTGNDKMASALRKFRQSILDILPVRGKVLNRSNDTLLIDVGKSEGIINGSRFVVLKSGGVRTADTGRGLIYRDEDVLGDLSITQTSEEIAEGEFKRKGFYDRLNIGDEVVLISLTDEEDEKAKSSLTLSGAHVVVNENTAALQDTAPAANVNGEKITGENASDMSASVKADLVPDVKNRTSSLISLIRSIY